MSNNNLTYFNEQGTEIKPSTPHTAHQNAVSERANAIVEEGCRVMIISAAPELKTLWPHASTYCVLLKNYTPTRALPDGKTPHQALLEVVGHLKPVPNLYNLRQWGEVGWMHIPKQTRVRSQAKDS
jgi:hypothetical protein